MNAHFDDYRDTHVLLVEDDAAFAGLVETILQAEGYRVTMAPDGVQGLKKVMAEDFDAIICDLMMPNLPGDMFYVAVQRVKPHLARKFIFITGHQGNPAIAKFIKDQKVMALYKPFPMHHLIASIKAAQEASVKTNRDIRTRP